MCEQLLNSGNEALKTIAFDWAYRQRKHYSTETFWVFESWLFKYIHDWGDCDDYCTHAFGTLLLAYPELSHRALSWTGHERFSVRRAAAVVFILPIRRKQYDRELLFKVADTLLYDEHYLVLKGYGWMLKVFSEQEPAPVIAYLRQHRDDMPRVAFRYALEKLRKDTRAELMKSSGDSRRSQAP
ncbi:MAG: DNA alkylation repair protein, partial [bacterium]